MNAYDLYILSGILIAAGITLLLRAVPFALLKKLRKSRFVAALGAWMPVGILLVLAATTFRTSLLIAAVWWIAPLSLAVTIVVHFLSKRNTAISVAGGTACYVLLIFFCS